MIEKNRAVFLDRDGTINREMGYLRDLNKLYIYSNTARAIRLLSCAGFKIIVVSNQSGVGRGMIKRQDFKNINHKIKESLARKGANIDAFYICPHHPDDNCTCRKPRTGLINKAAKKFGLELSSSYIIGDKLSDIELKKRAGLKEAVLVLTGFGKKHLCKAREDGVELGPVARDILSAARLILKIESL
jgi:histidinol-phosphate phosphatase family protein